MPSTYSDLKIELMATGENNTTWGDISNVNWDAMEQAVTGAATITFASADVTLTLTNTNALQTARSFRLICGGTTGGATRDLILGAGLQIQKHYIVQNNCAETIYVKNPTGTAAAVVSGAMVMIYNDGINVYHAINAVGASKLTGFTPGAHIRADGQGNPIASTLVSDDSINTYVKGDIFTGPVSGTGASAIELGQTRTADGAALVDFHTTPGSDFDARILRGSGASGQFEFSQMGPGAYLFSNSLVGEQMRINPNGFVGIGTNNPATVLQVKGISSQFRIETTTPRGGGLCGFDMVDPTGSKGWMGYPATNDDFYITNTLNTSMYFYTNNAHRMTIGADGQVTILSNLWVGGTFTLTGPGMSLYFASAPSGYIYSSSAGVVTISTGRNNPGAEQYFNFGPNGQLTVGSFTFWNNGNDGAGSGLDADLLDGQDGAYYANIPGRLGFTPVRQGGGPNQGFNTINIGWTPDGTGLRASVDNIDLGKFAFNTASGITWAGGVTVPYLLDTGTLDVLGTASLATVNTPSLNLMTSGAVQSLAYSSEFGAFTISTNRPNAGAEKYFVFGWDGQLRKSTGEIFWNSGNDGSGSGLDADVLDGQDGSFYSNIPARLGYFPVQQGGASPMGDHKIYIGWSDSGGLYCTVDTTNQGMFAFNTASGNTWLGGQTAPYLGSTGNAGINGDLTVVGGITVSGALYSNSGSQLTNFTTLAGSVATLNIQARDSGGAGAFQYYGSGGLLMFYSSSAGANVLQYTNTEMLPVYDGGYNLGRSGLRWNSVWCLASTMQTSDARVKDWRGGLTDVELAVAKDLVKEIGVYRWIRDIEKDGDAAKLQVGMTAQKIIEVFTNHGLDWELYDLVDYSEWEERIEPHPGHMDPETNEFIPGEEKVHPAGNGYSVRYTDLTMFMMVAQEQRLAALEALI